MSFLIGLLTVVMVLNCLLLILLVLIQLPKKEAGAGVAFGGAATDALFGAGTGNVLTKVTKYGTISFFLLTIFLGVLQGWIHDRPTSEFGTAVSQPAALPQPAAPTTAPSTPALPVTPPPTAPAAPAAPSQPVTPEAPK